MARELNRTVLAGGVIYPAGTAATKELEDAISNPEFWTGAADAESEAEGYAAQTVAELKDEIDRRNEGRAEEDRISKSGNKDDLIAALEADDEAQE